MLSSEQNPYISKVWRQAYQLPVAPITNSRKFGGLKQDTCINVSSYHCRGWKSEMGLMVLKPSCYQSVDLWENEKVNLFPTDLTRNVTSFEIRQPPSLKLSQKHHLLSLLQLSFYVYLYTHFIFVYLQKKNASSKRLGILPLSPEPKMYLACHRCSINFADIFSVFQSFISNQAILKSL